MIRGCVMPGLLVLALLLGSGCSSGPKALAPKSSQTVTLDASVKRAAVTARGAEELTLLLPPVEQPGYEWMLAGHDSRMLTQTSHLLPAPSPGGSATVRFVTQRVTPRTVIRFVLVRDRREDQPLDALEVLVTIEAEAAKK